MLTERDFGQSTSFTQQVGQLGVAILRHEQVHVVPPAPSARLAHDGEGWPANVEQDAGLSYTKGHDDWPTWPRGACLWLKRGKIRRCCQQILRQGR